MHNFVAFSETEYEFNINTVHYSVDFSLLCSTLLHQGNKLKINYIFPNAFWVDYENTKKLINLGSHYVLFLQELVCTNVFTNDDITLQKAFRTVLLRMLQYS